MPKSWSWEGVVTKLRSMARTASSVWCNDHGPPELTILTFGIPKLRAPICFNPAATRTYLPLVIKKTEFVLAGQSKAQMFESIKAAFDKKELPTPESGAMCYMMSKQGNLGDGNGHWHPHLMFFVPLADAATWGASLPGSPILASDDPQDRLTVFLIPVAKWSDGTPDLPVAH